MGTKLVYLFDEIGKEFTGTYAAQESPIIPGEFIAPINSTDKTLPAFNSETQKLIFDIKKNEWHVANIPVLLIPTLEQIKSRQWDAIKAERDRRKSGGVKVKVGTADKWFHSDGASLIQITSLVALGASIPTGLRWKTMDGTFVAIGQTVATKVLAAAVAGDQAIFGVAETHKAAMAACADPSTYDFSAGWPKIYGE